MAVVAAAKEEAAAETARPASVCGGVIMRPVREAVGGVTGKRKVMVVAEATRESGIALQYALSHAILENEELILLQIVNPSSWRYAISTFLKRPGTTNAEEGVVGGGAAAAAAGEEEFIEEMKRSCKIAQPKIAVRIVRVAAEAKDKAIVILSQAMALGIDIIVIGQRRSLSTAILGYFAIYFFS